MHPLDRVIGFLPMASSFFFSSRRNTSGKRLTKDEEKLKVQQDVNKYQENVTEAVVLVKTF